jgi:hypothetical protein
MFCNQAFFSGVTVEGICVKVRTKTSGNNRRQMDTWSINNPEYMRSTAGNTTVPYYSFRIQSAPPYAEKPLATNQTCSTSLLNITTPAALGSYLLGLYSTFLNVHGKRFAKPYTPTQLIKITTHVVNTEGSHDDDEYEWTLTPLHIDVKNGAFMIFWKATGQPIKIQLGIEDEPEPAPKESPAAEEVHFESLPASEEANPLRLTSDAQLRDKKTLHEARIRAKWAQYKAEKAIAKYVQRYGHLDNDLLTDSSDEEGETTDYESD